MNQTGRRQMPDEERAARDAIGLCVVMGGLASLWGFYGFLGVPRVFFGMLLLAHVSVLVVIKADTE